MKKYISIMAIVAMLIVVSACIGPDNQGEDDLNRFKGISTAEIDSNCVEYRDDVCALFECMVERCWCDDSSPELPILYEKEGISIADEEEAIAIVGEYIQDSEYKDYDVIRVIKLNNVFFNVFAQNADDEIVFTIAADGTIIKTICGV
ncbi:MAG: hypothetical protein KAR87_04995 [Candidatus Aenigmarchaeota archaeon]|nr:hypothetical protein [Candidatus Aenigmarchaeota archaeon]